MNLESALRVFNEVMTQKESKSKDPITKYDIRSKRSHIEFEIRFGLNKPLTKIEFERVYNKLISFGFVKISEQYHLKILTDDRIRCEISDLTNIKEYCETGIMPESTEYITKEKLTQKKFDNADFNFRISIQKEYKYDNKEEEIVELLRKLSDTPKAYRYMTRIKLEHPDKKGYCIDLSVVKSAKKDGHLIKENKFSVSKLFDSPESYEIEIEITDNSLVNKNTRKYYEYIKETIKYVLSGIQSTNFPISLPEQYNVYKEYCKLLRIKTVDFKDYIIKPDASIFIGPSSYTLQKINLVDDPANTNPCVLHDFCVTDKADGERKLYFITSNGKIYFITMNMNIQYTGSNSLNKELYGTIIDGEHILYDKHKKYINLYAAFDLYFIANKDVRKNSFIGSSDAYRYNQLFTIPKLINFNYISPVEHLDFTVKEFYPSSKAKTIQQCCTELFKRIESHLYPYETDGIIFTSNSLGVGMESHEDVAKNYKYTWKHSFKWKPPEFNTIDFLVKIKQIGKKDEVDYLETEQLSYKILNLFVGYNEKKSGYLNPQKILFEEMLKVPTESAYSAVLFTPTNPVDPLAHICYVPLILDNGENKMFTEEKEVIETDTVIEFRYEHNKDRRLSWIPMRIRYDKTEDYKQGKSFGNAYHVANSNWRTIHNPVTKDLITSDKEVTIEDCEDADVYYNTNDMSDYKTQNLKTYHNRYIKSMLIDVVSKTGDTLIDFAVGKGGDINKWNANKLKFVLGIDISKDNIHNPKDGACARFITLKKDWRKTINGLFIYGDSSKLIENGDFATNDDKQEEAISKYVVEQVMGKKPKQERFGKYIEKMYNIAGGLFDIGSIQFAVHYMFKDKISINGFAKNCSDMIKPGGYFIGTCYDGEKIFRLLDSVQTNKASELYIDEKKVWAVIKKYDKETFSKNNSLGYTIGVYQESINKVLDEYIVHFEYLKEIMGQYGFIPESPNKDIPAIDSFERFYANSGIVMSEQEQIISFLNNYFIFKKVTNMTPSETFKIYNRNIQGEEVDYSVGKPEKTGLFIILKK
jgi:hypothetical protein